MSRLYDDLRTALADLGQSRARHRVCQDCLETVCADRDRLAADVERTPASKPPLAWRKGRGHDRRDQAGG